MVVLLRKTPTCPLGIPQSGTIYNMQTVENTGEGIGSKEDEYKQGNPSFLEYRQLWALATARKLLTKFPLHLDIELTNACNLRCKMCWQNQFLNYPKGVMDFELFKKVIDEGVPKGLKAIKLQSRGESMMYPRIVETIRYAKEKGVLDIQLTTNSTYLTEEICDAILNSGLDMLIFSLDVGHKESFEQIYPGKSYETVIENIMRFLMMKRASGKINPYTRLQVLRFNGQIHPFVQKQIERLESYVNKVVTNNLFQLVDDGPLDLEKFDLLPCSYLWQRMVINYDGKVTMCCRDYNCEHVMGDINTDSIEEVWNGEKYRDYREFHEKLERQNIGACANCDMYAKPKLQPL